jgi:hypothetical protein
MTTPARQAALKLLEDLCALNESLTADDWYAAIDQADLQLQPKDRTDLWLLGCRYGWLVGMEESVISLRPERQGKQLQVYKSRLFVEAVAQSTTAS